MPVHLWFKTNHLQIVTTSYQHKSLGTCYIHIYLSRFYLLYLHTKVELAYSIFLHKQICIRGINAAWGSRRKTSASVLGRASCHYLCKSTKIVILRFFGQWMCLAGSNMTVITCLRSQITSRGPKITDIICVQWSHFTNRWFFVRHGQTNKAFLGVGFKTYIPNAEL